MPCYVSLCDTLTISSEISLIFNIRVFLRGVQRWAGQWPNSINWPMSCPVLLAQCFCSVMTSWHWFLCHDVKMFFLLWLHDRNNFHDVTMLLCMYMPGEKCITINNLESLIHIWRIPDSKIHGANMGPIWGRQDSGGPHVGPMNLAIWDIIC